MAMVLTCRERAAGYYSEMPFAIAQALVEIPYLLVQTILYSCASIHVTASEYAFHSSGNPKAHSHRSRE
jgi:hypothetical protein